MSSHLELIKFIRQLYNTKNNIVLHEPFFDEQEKKILLEVIDSNFVSSVGKMVSDFEEQLQVFTGSKNVIATSNGTSALHTALILADVTSDHEVLTQSLSFVATSNAISYLGASPIFIDVDRDSFSMSPDCLETFLDQNTEIRDDGFSWNIKTNKQIRACIIMHTFGLAGKMSEIKSICEKNNIMLIEDSAESLGSIYKDKHTGTMGDIGIISFNGNKIITTGGGGCLLINDNDLARKARHITTTAKLDNQWFFEHDQVAYNYRMPNLNAAVGIAQMGKLDFFITTKRKIANAYQDWALKKGVKLAKELPSTKSNYWLNALIAKDIDHRDKILSETNKNGVMTRPAWTPMHFLPMNSHYQKSSMVNTEWLFDRIVNLPSSVKNNLRI